MPAKVRDAHQTETPMHFPAPDFSSSSLAQLISLKGRNAVVTGGARGLGYAIARRLAEAGADILLGDKDERGVAQAAETLAKNFPRRVLARGLDVGLAASVTAFADHGVNSLGGIDIWVNNAGIYPAKPLLEMSDDQWDLMNTVNLRGTFLGCREAARRMSGDTRSGRSGGVIVNIASVAAFRGRAGLAHYSASKHGVIGLTKSAAVEFGRLGIRVLAVAPSLVETPGVEAMRAAAAQAGVGGDMIKAMEARVVAAFPLGRTGQPDDVARAVLFCASDLAAFMTGTTVFADGGLSAP
jgi:NAD(P)-dependent dehydrogenase (short-subunit alcohol dehydrogenase family)